MIRRILAGVLVVVLVVFAVLLVVAYRRKAALRAAAPPPADAWTVSRRLRFRAVCLDESTRTLPPGAAASTEAADRYCGCLGEAFEKAFPSYPRALRAAGFSGKDDPDRKKGAELYEGCAARFR